MEHYAYLAHHGVKGQKWGIRRYQNEDGTLTDAGKKRYGYYENPGSSKYERGHNRAYHDTRKQFDKVDTQAKKMRRMAKDNPAYSHAADVLDTAAIMSKKSMNTTLKQLGMGKKEVAYRQAGYDYSKYLIGTFGGQLVANALLGPIGNAAYTAARAVTPEGRRLGSEYNQTSKEYREELRRRK